MERFITLLFAGLVVFIADSVISRRKIQKKIKNLAKIKMDMPMLKVEQILGKPDKEEVDSWGTACKEWAMTWIYKTGTRTDVPVIFSPEGKVVGCSWDFFGNNALNMSQRQQNQQKS